MDELTPGTRPLSGASQHALALSRLQGHSPDADQLDRLARLDSGAITSDQAIAELVAKYQQ